MKTKLHAIFAIDKYEVGTRNLCPKALTKIETL